MFIESKINHGKPAGTYSEMKTEQPFNSRFRANFIEINEIVIHIKPFSITNKRG